MKIPFLKLSLFLFIIAVVISVLWAVFVDFFHDTDFLEKSYPYVLAIKFLIVSTLISSAIALVKFCTSKYLNTKNL